MLICMCLASRRLVWYMNDCLNIYKESIFFTVDNACMNLICLIPIMQFKKMCTIFFVSGE